MNENCENKLGNDEVVVEQNANVPEERRKFMKKALKGSMFAVGAMTIASVIGEPAFAGHADHWDDTHDDWTDHSDHSDHGDHDDSGK